MTSFNCFKNCCKFDNKDDSKEHHYKLKKGLKLITTERRKENRVIQTQTFLTTQGSPLGQVNQGQEIVLREKNIKRAHGRKIRQFSSENQHGGSRFQSSFYGSEATRNSFAFTGQPYNQTSSSIQPRQRRYSLQSTPKPHLTLRPPSLLTKQRVKYQFSNQKQNQRFLNQSTSDLVVFQPSVAYPYGICTINEQSQEKTSSLFQGAKSIVSRMVTSRKRNEIIGKNKVQTSKMQKKDGRQLFDEARLCETQNVLGTNSSIVSEECRKLQFIQKTEFNEISLDSIPMSPRTKANLGYEHFKVGRLLGIGRWAHVYLCQQKHSSSIFAIKQIFKQSFKMSCSITAFNESISQLQCLHHQNLMGINAKFQTIDKLCVLVEYCNRNVFEEVKERGLLPLRELRRCVTDLVRAVVYLHENERIHGSINIFQIFMMFSQCKLKHSLSACTVKEKIKDHRIDIQGLAIAIFEMGHGLIPFMIKSETLYEAEKMYKDPGMREKILQFINKRIHLKENDQEYRELNQFIGMLLMWKQGCRLVSGVCLDHPFLELREQK